MRGTRRWFSKLLAAVGAFTPWTKALAAGSAPEADDFELAKALTGFPYEIVSVSGKDAEAEWTRLVGLGRGWPVVLGNRDDIKDMADMFHFMQSEDSRTPQAIVEAAATIRIPEDIEAWQKTDGYGDYDEPLGEWPDNVPSGDLGLSVASDILSRKLFPKVYIAILPTGNSWEVPAYLRWGGFNACPPPEHHVALLKSWHDRYGAVMAGLADSVINLKVSKPVTDKAEALALARQQYAYCPDIVDQGTNDIATLAATLVGQRWWYFWWD